MYDIKDITNKIIYGDCLEEMRKIPDESVDLIYLDPPFFSNRTYEVIWGDEFDNKKTTGFDDIWKEEGGRVGDIEVYKDYMKERLEECHRILKKTGTIFLHCDKHANHHLRLILDDVFGINNFLNEIIWCYKSGKYPDKKFATKHDNIYWYSKSTDWIFNKLEVLKELAEGSEKRYNKIDTNGRKYAKVKTGGKWKNYYLDEVEIVMEDWWIDVPMLKGNYTETLGYPTQKPEALLERIIKAASNKGDIILDPFCGCGTTVAVAKKLKRNYIGIDVSWTACKLMIDRLNKIEPKDNQTYYDVINWRKNADDFKSMDWIIFQDTICDSIGAKSNPKKVADDGIDGTFIDDTLIQVKQWENAIGNREVQRMSGILGTHRKKDRSYPVGVIIGFKFSKKAEEERIKAKNSEGKIIVLLTVDEIVDNDLNKLKDAGIKRFDRGLLGKTWD